MLGGGERTTEEGTGMTGRKGVPGCHPCPMQPLRKSCGTPQGTALCAPTRPHGLSRAPNKDRSMQTRHGTWCALDPELPRCTRVPRNAASASRAVCAESTGNGSYDREGRTRKD